MADEPTQHDDAVEAEPVAPAAPAVKAEPVAPVPVPPVDTGYTASGVPTFESVREKIETRYGTALGSAELDAATPEGRSVEEQYEARQRAAHDKLEEIRASMHQQDKP
jgi:phage shock protein A